MGREPSRKGRQSILPWWRKCREDNRGAQLMKRRPVLWALAALAAGAAIRVYERVDTIFVQPWRLQSELLGEAVVGPMSLKRMAASGGGSGDLVIVWSYTLSERAKQRVMGRCTSRSHAPISGMPPAQCSWRGRRDRGAYEVDISSSGHELVITSHPIIEQSSGR